MFNERPVVVGVDGSDNASAAVLWGAAEAALRSAPLLLVTAFNWPETQVVGEAGTSRRYRDLLLDRSRDHLEAAKYAARQAQRGVDVETRVVFGPPIVVLASESAARLLVLGSRGLGGVNGLLAGSVAVTLAAHAHCPVVVVRPGQPSPSADAPVVVGDEGGSTGEAALAWAFDAAEARGVPLEVVHAYDDRAAADPLIVNALNWRIPPEDELRALDTRLAPWREKYPRVTVRPVVTVDRPAHALVERSRHAQLVVVGSRGRANLAGLVLGSVGHGVLHRSHCPVAVVRPDTGGGTR